jgi:RND family efflux transporter MFP subunit
MKTPQFSRSTLTIALCVALGATGLLAISQPSNAQAPKPAAAPKASMTITTGKPSQATLPMRLSANGNIAAWQDASVGSEASGLRLAEVLVNVGDFVKRGQVLAVFASESVLADVAQARAGVAEATANLADATANAERARTLQSTGAMSTQQINQFLTGELTAKARLESAKATLLQQELRQKHTQVLAPDSGIISARSATVGAVVGAGTELFRLIRQGRLEWRAEVTSAELGRVKAGTKVQVTTASGARVDGKVRMVAPTVDPQTRTALVYVDMNTKPDGSAVKAGMYARGEFELGASGALTVPQQSLVVRDGFNYLFKIGTDNKASQQKVEVGRRVGDQVEITQGIAPDTTIAISGAGFLNDGDTVRVNNANNASNTPAATAQPAQAATK